MALRRQAGLPACICLLLGASAIAHAQESSVNPQGMILYNIGKWLTSNNVDMLKELGWTYGGNPCTGWSGVECNSEGYVSAINLANKGLQGSLPAETSLWGGLTGLTTLDLAGNSLGGQVPSQITAAGPQLVSINLSGNTAVCGTAPAGVAGLDSTGTNLGTDCSAVTETTPPTANATAQDGATTGSTTVEAPDANTTRAAPEPAVDTTAAAAPAPAPEPVAVPAPPPAVIANAPICSCALKAFGSDDCAAALKNTCSQPNPPEVCAAGDPSVSEPAAQQLGQYLAQACFPGQNMDTSICNCVQNLLGTDCAKARVTLCVSKDPTCLPFQNIIDVNGSSNAAAVGKVAPVLEQQCPVVDPAIPGVKATMEFPDLSIGQYITRQYTQNVANALSTVTNVPSTSISTLDVRPFLGGSGRRRRALLQSSGNGVQATYFLATQDPADVSAKLSQAANDGTLSTRLGQYGIQAQASGLRVQSILPPPPAEPRGKTGFPMWAVGVIVAAGVLLVLGAVLLWCCCLRKRRGKKTKEYAPEAKGSAAVSTQLSKSAYDYTPPSPGSYSMPVTAGAAAGVGAAAAAPSRMSSNVSSKGEELPVSRSVKGIGGIGGPESVIGSNITRWESNSTWGGGNSSFARPAAAAGAPGSSLAPVRTSSGSFGSAEMAGGAAAGAAAAAAAAAAGTAGEPSSAASGWRSNVRPASGQVPAAAGATSSMSAAAGKGSQQAERAKFWAQFQDTWQQVRQTKNIRGDDDPGTPSSGTNWTDVTGKDEKR